MSTSPIDHDDENIALEVFVLAVISLLVCWSYLGRAIFNYIFPHPNTTEARPTPTLPGPRVVAVARFPANGRAPCLVRLETTTKALIQGVDVFPSHIPNVWKFWNLPENMSIYRDWKTTEIRNQPFEECDGIYLTIYSFAPHLQENHHVPETFQPRSRMQGDVFVAKLDKHHCGKHGQAAYEDIHRQFLKLPCVVNSKAKST